MTTGFRDGFSQDIMLPGRHCILADGMISIALLGIPNDDNSSFLKGAAAAPPNIRRELWSDANNIWTETGVDLSVPGTLRDQGDLQFRQSRDPWEYIETRVFDVLSDGV